MRFAPVVLLALLGVVLFAGITGTGAIDVREARDAQVVRELQSRREVLTPLYAGDPLLEKPIAAYLPEILAWRGRGAPLASRIVRAVLAGALVLVTVVIGARHFGVRAGWLAGAVLVTTLVVPLAARTDGTQVLATLLAWVACAGFADAAFGHPRGRELRLVVTWAALAATIVIAGPLPALWPVLALALFAALARDRAAWRNARPLAGMALVVAAALPWYGALAERRGAWFLTRVAGFPYGAEPRGPWIAAPVLALSFLAVGMFPWSAVLPAAATHAAGWWRGRPLLRIGARGPELAEQPLASEAREQGATQFLAACLLSALVPVLVYPAPPLTAALPALPAGALLLGRFVDHLLEDPARVAGAFVRTLPLLALSGSAAAVLLAVLAPRLGDAAQSVRLLATVMLVTAWLPALAAIAGRPRVAALLVALPVAIGAPTTTLRVLPALEGWLDARDVATAMNAGSPPLAPLVVLDPEPPSLRLHLRRNLVPDADVSHALRAWRAPDGATYVAVRPYRERAFARAAGVPVEVLLRSPTLVLLRVRAP